MQRSQDWRGRRLDRRSRRKDIDDSHSIISTRLQFLRGFRSAGRGAWRRRRTPHGKLDMSDVFEPVLFFGCFGVGHAP